MQARVRLGVGLVLACFLPCAAVAQSQPAASSAALDTLAREIRLLRQTLERQAAATGRAQLVIARLTLADQRMARARAVVARLENEAAGAERQRDQLHTALRENARALEEVTEPERRQQLETQSRMMKAQITDSGAQASRIEARPATARQALDAEAGKYDELERWLNDLDRHLQPGQ